MNSANFPALKQLKENWKWYLTLGIILVVLGILAIAFSLITTVISVVYLGFLITAIGIFEGIQAFKLNRWGNFFLHGLLSLFYIIGGLFIAFNPIAGAISLTLLLGAFFLVSGTFRIIFSFVKNIPNRGLIFFNGIIALILGFLILYGWPVTGLWVIGVFVGIDALFIGINMIILALNAKNLKIENY